MHSNHFWVKCIHSLLWCNICSGMKGTFHIILNYALNDAKVRNWSLPVPPTFTAAAATASTSCAAVISTNTMIQHKAGHHIFLCAPHENIFQQSQFFILRKALFAPSQTEFLWRHSMMRAHVQLLASRTGMMLNKSTLHLIYNRSLLWMDGPCLSIKGKSEVAHHSNWNAIYDMLGAFFSFCKLVAAYTSQHKQLPLSGAFFCSTRSSTRLLICTWNTFFILYEPREESSVMRTPTPHVSRTGCGTLIHIVSKLFLWKQGSQGLKWM